MSVESEIMEREKLFWTGSEEDYQCWLARDVLMVFPPPAGILKRDEILVSIRSANRWTSIEMTDVSFHCVGESAAVLGYRARARKADSTEDYLAFVGSVYVREDGEWKLAFHQHTPIFC